MSVPIRATALVALLVLLTSQVRSADEKMLTSDYFPLAVGTKWTYRAGAAAYTLEVTKHEKVDGILCARIDMIANKKSESYEHVAVTGDGIVRVSHEGKVLKPYLKFLQLPPKHDAPWTVESKIDGKLIKGTFKTSLTESVKTDKDKEGKERPIRVKVAAGDYPAIMVSGNDMEVSGAKLNLTYYFTEKVGMTKQIMELAGQKVVVELEKYEPGK
jgi:hypothetical protein